MTWELDAECQQKKTPKEARKFMSVAIGQGDMGDNADEHGKMGIEPMTISIIEMRSPEGGTRSHTVGVGGLREVALTIDSGAGDAVMPVDMRRRSRWA